MIFVCITPCPFYILVFTFACGKAILVINLDSSCDSVFKLVVSIKVNKYNLHINIISVNKLCFDCKFMFNL